MTSTAAYLRASTDAAIRTFDVSAHAVKRGWIVVRRAMQARRERHALAKLDDRMLKDIGLTRSEAYRESRRDVFDLPAPRSSRTFRW